MRKTVMASSWLMLCFVGMLAPGARGNWSFAMLGDTRGERDTTTTGVSTYLSNIAAKIATLNPDLVLVSGDLVNGNDVPPTSSLTNYALQFDNWKAAMQPVFNYTTGTGIPIYPVRGNHENCDNEGPPIHHLKEAYYTAFTNYVPLNGPDYGSTNNQIGYSYSFTHNNANFVAADQYFYYSATNPPGYHELARDWVIQQFARTNLPFNIFMAHEPFFNAEHSTPGGFLGDTAGALQVRRDFWNALGTNGVQLYLTGHIHNEIVASTSNAFGNKIVQLIAGNGGAALGPVGGGSEAGVQLLLTNDTHYGFSLATVSSVVMTIEYYLLNPSNDTWSTASYTTPITVIPEPASLVLLLAGMVCLLPLAKERRRLR